MLRRVLTLPRSASADGYDEHVQCDAIASLSSETKRRKAAGVRRIVIPGRPWQIGATFGATPGGHTRSSWGAERPYFTGLSRSHFIMAEREGLSARVPGTSKTAVKSAFPDNRGGLCVPAVCTGPSRSAQAESNEW